MIKFDMVTLNYPKLMHAMGRLSDYRVLYCGGQGYAVIRMLDIEENASSLLFSVASVESKTARGWDTKQEAQTIADFLNSTIVAG